MQAVCQFAQLPFASFEIRRMRDLGDQQHQHQHRCSSIQTPQMLKDSPRRILTHRRDRHRLRDQVLRILSLWTRRKPVRPPGQLLRSRPIQRLPPTLAER